MAQVSAPTLTGPKLDNRRVLAGIVDLLIVGAGALVVLYAGDALTGDRGGALGAVILGWALYYYFALESGAGQTVGKRLMKLRVVRADGRPAGMREIAVRTVLRVVDGIGMYIVGLIVMLVTGERRQRIGDLAAATIVVDASGPATAVAEPAAPAEADAEVEDDDEVEAVAGEEPVAEAAEPTATITLPSRPTPPEPLSGMGPEEAAEEAEPIMESEPVVEAEPVLEDAPVVETEPVVEDEPAEEAESFEVEPYEVKPFHVEPIDVESMVPVDSTVEVAEPAVEVEDAPAAEVEEAPPVEVEEPEAADTLPPAMSPSLEGLAADVAAAQQAPQEAAQDEQAPPEAAQDAAEDASHEDAPGDDEPVNVKSVETVSAMDLIMGAAEEDSAKPDEDEGPASA
ncbi:MAG TPA: RDD family protein [Thermoleophilaceae bacterium]